MRTLVLAALVLLVGTAQAATPDAPAVLPDILASPASGPQTLVDPLGAPLPETPAAPAVPGSLGAEALDVPATLPEAAGPLERSPLRWTPPAIDEPLVAATVAASGGAFLVLAGFALYSRLARSELLDHERRDAVLKLVKESPGIPLTDIATKLGMAWGTAVYHLDRLERGGFLVSEKTSGRRCYFPVGAVSREDRAGLGALQQETTRDVAQFVATRPGATQTELCEGLGLSASAASKQVTKLESAGLLRREREWKTVTLHPQPQLAQLLAA